MNFDQIHKYTKALSDFATKLNELIDEIIGRESKNPGGDLEQLPKKVKKMDNLLGKLPEGYTPPSFLRDFLEEMEGCIEERQQFLRFSSNLAGKLEPLGLRLEGTEGEGLKVGFLLLKLDFDRDRVNIFYGQEKELLADRAIRVGEVQTIIEGYLKKDGLASSGKRPRVWSWVSCLNPT